MATGTPIRMARPVTQILPIIIGKIPKMLFPGFQTVPVRNFSGPILKIAGTPFINRKIQISATASTEQHAAIRKTNFIIVSLSFIDKSFPCSRSVFEKDVRSIPTIPVLLSSAVTFRPTDHFFKHVPEILHGSFLILLFCYREIRAISLALISLFIFQRLCVLSYFTSAQSVVSPT